ncbi:hypothetical protein AMECASPLE_018762, partial [Ameca splendens]
RRVICKAGGKKQGDQKNCLEAGLQRSRGLPVTTPSAGRFCDNIEDMIGYKPLPWFKYCWHYITPLICVGTLVFLLLRYTPMRFNNMYVYPWWAYWIGWFLAMSSLSMIPLNMVIKLAKEKGSLWQRLKTASQPADDLPGMTKEIPRISAMMHVQNKEQNDSML